MSTRLLGQSLPAMAKKTLEITKEVEFVAPNMNLNRTEWTTIGDLVIGDIIHKIDKQIQHDGSPLKSNPPGYAAMKAEKNWTQGGVVKALIARFGRLVRRYGWARTVQKFGVTVRPRSGIEQRIVQNVQERGYTGWMKPGKEFEKALRELLKQVIEKKLRKAAKGKRA